MNIDLTQRELELLEDALLFQRHDTVNTLNCARDSKTVKAGILELQEIDNLLTKIQEAMK